MNKNDPFKIFENAGDDFIENLEDSPRFTDIEKERMFKMSMNIYNEMRKNNSMDNNITERVSRPAWNKPVNGVEGVETYSRPVWYKPLITAAACLVAVAGIAGTASFLKNHRGNHGVVNTPEVIATQVITTTVNGSDNAFAAVTSETTSVTTDVSGTSVSVSGAVQSEATSAAQTAAAQQTVQNNTAAETQAPNTQAPAETNAPAETTTVSEENRMLVSRGQQMFDYACRMYWGFRSGSSEIMDAGEKDGEPFYDADGVPHYPTTWTVSYDDNGEPLGTLINDPDINSVDDAVARYHEIFSERYPDNIRDYFREYNGRAYWYTGQRGGNIFYLASVITGVQRITDDEIFFTIEHHYDPEIEQHGIGQAIVTETFSVVVQPDGSWKVGEFHLPN